MDETQMWNELVGDIEKCKCGSTDLEVVKKSVMIVRRNGSDDDNSNEEVRVTEASNADWLNGETGDVLCFECGELLYEDLNL